MLSLLSYPVCTASFIPHPRYLILIPLFHLFCLVLSVQPYFSHILDIPSSFYCPIDPGLSGPYGLISPPSRVSYPLTLVPFILSVCPHFYPSLISHPLTSIPFILSIWPHFSPVPGISYSHPCPNGLISPLSLVSHPLTLVSFILSVWPHFYPVPAISSYFHRPIYPVLSRSRLVRFSPAFAAYGSNFVFVFL